MNNVLAIYDKESSYAKGLLDYILKHMKVGLKVHAFTNITSLNEYAKNHVITVLLIHESIDLEEIDHSNIKNICILWEGMKDEINSTYASIYKFQSAKVIMEQLFMKFPNELLHKLEANRNSTLEILSVCSLDKKKKQSNLTYYLAREYSKHKKVLYINLHSWQILSKTQFLKEYNGISEIIYYLRQKSPNFIIKMNHAVVKVNGLDCIYGTSFGLEVDELTTEDTRMWIEQLQMWNQYEIVVFDVGNINIGTLELLHNSNKIIYTIEENIEDKLELDIFKYQLEFAGYEDVVNKIITCDISKEKEECIRQFIH